MALTKEESRVSLIAAGAALFGTLIGSLTAVWGTYAKFAEDKKAQIEATRNQAYTQLKGQQAEFLVLFQQLAVAHDKSTLYQVRAAQQMIKGNDRRKAHETKGVNDQGGYFSEGYLSDAQQQERNAEHYADELVTCSEKMFESIGLTQLSFSPDAVLNEKIARAESLLTRTDDIFPKESMRSRVIWAMTADDAEEQISTRQKQRLVYIVKATEPITDLLSYLQERIRKDSSVIVQT